MAGLLGASKKKPKKKEKMKVPKTVQASIPYRECYENGVFQVGEGVFSQTYRFDDISFKTLSDEDQEGIYDRYQAFLNALSPEETLTFHFVNRPENMAVKLEKVSPQARGDDLDRYREELSGVLADKFRSARNNITTGKYFTITVQADSVDDAMRKLLDTEERVVRDLKAVTRQEVRPLTLAERLELMNTIYNSDEENHFFEHDVNGKIQLDWKRAGKLGLTSKDIIAPAGLKFSTNNFQIGERFGQSVFLDDIANWLSTNFIAELSECTFESTINLNICPIEQRDGIKLVHNQAVNITAEVMEAQKKAYRGGYSPDFISMDLRNAKAQIDELQEDMANRDQRVFFFSMVITHFAESKEQLKEHFDMLRNTASKAMCSIKPLMMQQERGLTASLPTGVNRTFTKRLMTTESLGVFIPFNEVSKFDQGGFYYGVNSVNKTVVAHNRKNGKNYNGLILGSSGSGKSFSAKREMINVLLSTEDDVYVVDPDGEYSKLAEAFGGTVLKITPGGQVHLNPMDLDVDTSFDTECDPIAMKVDFVSGLLETMKGRNGVLTPVQKSIVDRCIRQVYNQYLANLANLPPDRNGRRKTIDRDICPTLQNLFDLLLSQPQAEAQELALIMETYTTGSFSTFAHQTNRNVDARLLVYNIRDIGTNLREIGLKVCLNDIWNRIVANRSLNKWTWFYVDEFHLLLSSPSTAEFVKSIWKRARKFQGMPTGITQDAEDLLTSTAARAIVNNTETIMILNQSLMGRNMLRDLLSLSDADVAKITNANPGCGLLWTAGQRIPFNDDFPTNTELFKIMTTKEDDSHL